MSIQKLFQQGFCIAALSFSVVTQAAAQDSGLPGSFSGNVTLTNDYVFRGFTQTGEDPAIQGGLDWDSGSGFYLGTWASNVDFGPGDEANIEIDIYGGYAGEINGFTYDVGYLYYLYPGAPGALDYDFWEVYGSVGYDFGTAAVSLVWPIPQKTSAVLTMVCIYKVESVFR